ncbi:MAG: DivIVA domain-containing protein [Desulfobacteraceae bacterium]|nr:DivIVA domain-containing protein [Desulfobacteraceae bacterium]MBU4001123.1 DivIVA domain-containing protein [Pseudomonadota bacterium]MBU4053242.1 DivIVA domain-containing protein [Pseudomonadota bacterium]
MKLSSTDIQNKQFRVRFRGFDVQEVDIFLEEMAYQYEALQAEIKGLKSSIKLMEEENNSFRAREETIKGTMAQSQKIIEQMKENARKSANNIIGAAEINAEKILSSAHNRLSQLHSDISELKQQRMQIEIQLQSMLEGHIKLLEHAKMERQAHEGNDEKLKMLKQAKSSI